MNKKEKNAELFYKEKEEVEEEEESERNSFDSSRNLRQMLICLTDDDENKTWEVSHNMSTSQ